MGRLLSAAASRRAILVVCALTLLNSQHARAQVVISEWNTGNGSWNVPANWSPADVPDNGGGFTYDVLIGNRPVATNAQVTFIPEDGASDTVSNLTVSNGADFFTNGSQLVVATQTIVDGAGSTIRIDPFAPPGTASLVTANLDLNNGGGLTMSGGIVNVSGGQLEINAGSVLGGNGTVNIGDNDAVAEQAFENSGLIQPQGNTAAPQTLTIHAAGVDTIDLDGDNESGIIDVDNALANVNADTVTLVIDGPLMDPFGGGVTAPQIQIGQRDTLTFTHDFAIAGLVGSPVLISMNGGNDVATLNGAGAGTSVAGSAWTTSGATRVLNNMTFTGTANTITVGANASLELGGTVTLPDASALSLTSTSELIITGAVTVNEAAGDFNWDGPGVATTTIKGTGQLSLTVNRVDSTNDVYGGTLNLNDDGDVSVNNTANVWTIAGTVNKNNVGSSSITGDAVNVTGNMNVTAGTLSLPTTTLSPGAAVNIVGTMTLGGASTLAGPTSITGTGTLRLLGTSTVTANTTINTTSFDWDGSGSGTTHTISSGVTFTINSTIWDADDAGDVDDPISIGGSGGTLAVNNVTSWTMTRTLTTNSTAVGITSLNGDSRMIMSGASAIWNANGQTAVNAPVTFGAGSSANIAAGGFIRLNGGDAVSIFNRIEGATINGPGGLLAINAHELRGFGTINAPITFQNASALRADDGTLTINGAINQAPTIGTADADGVLNVVNAWNSNVATNVVLNGGTLQGGAITVANAKGIKGHGLVSSRVINNTRLEANVAAQTLVFNTAANDNDWDGGANTGVLAASNGSTLEVRDNATFTYGGTVTATGASRVYARGFGFNFGPASTINLTGSTLQTDESTSIDGDINVAAGADSTINVQINRFLTLGSTSVSTLNGNLRLMTNNGAIEAGATFSGPGAVIVPDNSHLILENGANVNALVVNEGTIRPSGFNTVGAETIKDFQQTNLGLMEFELTGTLLNQFDRLSVTGVAQLAGALVIDIDGAFVPALGNTFNIITAPTVTGQFDYADASGMPAGLAFHINYLANAVQLQVVNKPIFSADFDDDGDVDQTDLAIWDNAFDLNQLGDADGDNDSDGNDFLLWQQQLGSKPAVAAAGAVPEPGMMTLAATGSIALVSAFRQARRKLVCESSISTSQAARLALP